MREYDLVIVGGGPAGLAAAAAAKASGIDSILILERDRELGGILNQCIHNGFGLHTFKEELTGPEYAARFIERVRERKIEYKLNTMVMEISPQKAVTAMNREEGLFEIKARAVILAMGCRERSRGALNIPGYRPAGIYSAGTAQRLVNMEGFMPGREVVILGSGDIGLIMARRMTLEGAKVKVVAELMPYSGGLKRNIVQCLNDYGIPLKLSHTVVEIRGKERLTARCNGSRGHQDHLFSHAPQVADDPDQPLDINKVHVPGLWMGQGGGADLYDDPLFIFQFFSCCLFHVSSLQSQDFL